MVQAEIGGMTYDVKQCPELGVSTAGCGDFCESNYHIDILYWLLCLG